MGAGPSGDDGEIACYLLERFAFGDAMESIGVARLSRGFANQAQIDRGQTNAVRDNLCAAVERYAIWIQDLTAALSEAEAIRRTNIDRSAALLRAMNTHLRAFLHLQSQPIIGTNTS